MKLPEAKKLLERVIEKKVAVAYRRYHKEVPHRRTLTEPFYAGRYPQKAAGRLLRLLEELEANAEYRNLDTERLKIIHAAALIFSTQQLLTLNSLGSRPNSCQ
jgi:large subunit ribosomal protein L22